MNPRKTIHVTFALALAAVFMSGAVIALAGEEPGHHDESKKEVTLVGEVLDLYCFMQHPADGQGPGHAKCAKSCINKGLPIGFLADGVVYVIIGSNHESAKDMVVDFAGGQARLTGTLITHDGIKSIELKSIEKIDASGGK
ncbi:MAG: hypothetical protein V3V49_07015 [Candidatus Krumholzibacteria bacterium]